MILVIGIIKILLFQIIALQPDLRFVEANGAVSLYQGGELVFSYQIETKSHNGQYPRANYVHPLNDFSGQALTEDFPEDHLHQRGIFWTWHQLFLNGESLADPWICEGIEWRVHSVKHEIGDQVASVQAQVDWLVGVNRKHLLREQLEINYQPFQDYYTMDFNIVLESLQDGLEIGGSDDNKGYGGFSARLWLGDKVTFEGSSGRVMADNQQVQAGNWILVSNIGPNRSQVAIMYHPESTANLKGWILRDKGSMQNPVWPGRERETLNQGDQVDIRARLVVFRGQPKTKNTRRTCVLFAASFTTRLPVFRRKGSSPALVGKTFRSTGFAPSAERAKTTLNWSKSDPVCIRPDWIQTRLDFDPIRIRPD